MTSVPFSTVKTAFPATAPKRLAAVQTYVPPSSIFDGSILRTPSIFVEDSGMLPSTRLQRMLGCGSPVAVHLSSAGLPSRMESVLGVISTTGALPTAMVGNKKC